MCTVPAASGAASVRVWHITSRGWDPWTERPLPEVVRIAYPLVLPTKEGDLKDGSSRGRFAELDALRALAVTIVVWGHSVQTEIGFGQFKIGGYHAVLLFFVISGFLITGILLDVRSAWARRGDSRWSGLAAFYVRRFLRIFPIYYFGLLAAFTLMRATVQGEMRWHLTYLSNWYFAYNGTFGFSSVAHLWSLGVEEQFYLLWPWFVLFLPEYALPWTLAGMILTGPVSRLALGILGFNDLSVWITTPTVLDALGLGCLLAYLWRKTSSADRFARWAVILALVLGGLYEGMTVFDTPAYARDALKLIPLALFCMWLVHRASRGFTGWTGRLLRARPLVYVGKISYAIYLLHTLTVNLIETRIGSSLPVFGQPGLPLFVAVMVITVGAASLSWRFFEQPINSLKDRFPYAQRFQPFEEKVALEGSNVVHSRKNSA